MLEALDLLRVHKATIENIQPKHPELSQINDLIAHGQKLIDEGNAEVKPYIDFETLPQIADSMERELVERINFSIGRVLSDYTHLRDLFYWERIGTSEFFSALIRTPESWIQFMSNVSSLDANRITRNIETTYRLRLYSDFHLDLKTVGDLRRIPLEELVKGRNMDYKSALFMLHAFKPANAPSDS